MSNCSETRGNAIVLPRKRLCGVFGLFAVLALVTAAALAQQYNPNTSRSGAASSAPSGSGGVSPRCRGSVAPPAFADPDGFAKFLRNCLEQPAYAGTPPLRLTAGTYDVYNRGYNGAQLTPLGWATISVIGNGPDPDYQVTNSNSTYVLRPGQPIQEGRVFLNIRYKKPVNSNTWTQLNPPQPIRYIRRFAGALEYDVYYQNNVSETWLLRPPPQQQ
jgi:hypothetical protein